MQCKWCGQEYTVSGVVGQSCPARTSRLGGLPHEPASEREILVTEAERRAYIDGYHESEREGHAANVPRHITNGIRALKQYWRDNPRELTDAEAEKIGRQIGEYWCTLKGKPYQRIGRFAFELVQQHQFYAPEPEKSEFERKIESLKWEKGPFRGSHNLGIDAAVRLCREEFGKKEGQG